MTLKDERTRAIRYAKEFLRELLDPKQTPRVSLDIRRRARAILKHYPSDLDLMRPWDTLEPLTGEEVDKAYEESRRGK